MNRREFLSAAGVMTVGGLFGAKIDEMEAPRKGAGKAYLWEDLTVDDFLEGVRESKGVVLVPLGCLEKHGHHLPLATDSIVACELARRAAEKESAVVFPFSPFGLVAGARHTAGTIALTSETMYRVFDELCAELSRNGLKKIVIVNDHGGNNLFLDNFLRSRLERRYDYQVFHWFKAFFTDEFNREFAARFAGKPPRTGHACTIETSEMMHLRPETVHLERYAGDADGMSRRHHDAYEEFHVTNSIDWFASYPTQMAGEVRGSGPELGEWLLESCSDTLAKVIRLIKEDETTATLTEEFQSGADHPHA